MTPARKTMAIAIAAALIAYLGIAAFLMAFWQNMDTSNRILATFGGGMMLHVVAMAAWQRNPQNAVLGAIFFLAAAPVQSIGIYILIAAIFPGIAASGGAGISAMLLMALQEYIVQKKYPFPVVLSACIAFLYGFALDLLHFLGSGPHMALLVLSASMLLVAHGLTRTRAHAAAPLWYALGCALGYSTLFSLTRATSAEVIYVAAIFAGFYAALRLASSALLWFAAIFTIAYLAYGDTAYVMHGPLWSLALPLLALAIFACIALTRQLQRRYLS